mgnify:CR=1 FL=1
MDLLRSFAPKGDRRMGANPHANGGLLLRDLRTPDFRDYGVEVPAPGEVEAQDMLVLGGYVRDVMKLNLESRNFRIFAPDETASNRLHPVFEVTGRRFLGERYENEDRMSTWTRTSGDGLHAVRAHVRGLAGGLPAHRPPRLLQQLRGIHPHRGLHVRPACQVAEDLQRAALAAGYRLFELYPLLQCVAAGP